MNIPKPLAGELTALVQDRRIPQYRTIEDIGRDAVYHRAKQIARMADDGDLENAVDLAMMISDELAIVEREEQAEEYLGAVRANASRMVQRREWPALKRYLAEREGYASTLPSPWREELEEMVDDFRKQAERGQKRRGRGK